MARYLGPVCRQCRREGEKLFLKGERCYTNKCAVEKRQGGPGQHGKARGGRSDFKVQLREKQKVKRMFGLLEKQFHKYFEWASKHKGVTGTQMLVNLESRLDNTVYRIGFAFSRRQARQLVSHGHVTVNGKRVNVASYQVRVGDKIEIVEAMKKNIGVGASMASAVSRMLPSWLGLDKDAVSGTVNSAPTREQLPSSINEQLIVELYSR